MRAGIRIFGLLSTLLITWSAVAEPIYVIETPESDDAAIANYTQAGYVVDGVGADGATLYLTGPQLWEFEVSGVPYTLVEVQDGRALKGGANNGTTLGTYMSYETITTMLQNWAATYPAICRLDSLGQSVQGRELWRMQISDNVGIEEAEPEFKYVGNMHGDETVSSVVLLYLIDLLLTQYGSDARIAALVNSTDISIVPHMNPDGYELVQRANANGIDLNRHFPSWSIDFTDTAYDGAPLGDGPKQPEVAAIMQWSAANSFVLSANLHGGALLVNYPLDYFPGVPTGSYAIAPDDGILIEVSQAYASGNDFLRNNSPFAGGIVNGSDWYSVTGGMQDWNYWYLSCFELTLELSFTKRPAENTLPGHWNDNREALLRYMEQVHRGVQGIVRDAATNAPLHARVIVDAGGVDVYTDPDVGDYHRLLVAGTHTLTFQAAGYFDKTHVVDVGTGPATIQDVLLIPFDNPFDVDGDSNTNAADIQAVINAVLGLGSPLNTPDVNGDGSVNAADVQAIINAVLF